ncbi:hypothetical protein [Stanieria cyanosphaera]|uniref:hypothetical protein n=1 Tax=Stanieria cyanosphaera TaxID=102116 RepID=UPI0002DF3885|nr:hypothetical protein [Stanieria cyanosphaera]
MNTNTSKSWWQQYREAVRRSRLHQELLMLLHGQQDQAQRLINLEKSKNPGHLETWYLNKVIYDLRKEA